LEWGETLQSAERDSIINNHNTNTFRTVSDNTNWDSYDHHGLQSGVGHLPIPSDSKRINSVLIGNAEQIITEDGSRLVAEPDEGFLMMEPRWEEFNATVTTDGKQYYNNGWTVDPTEELILEDDGRMALEVATDNEDAVKFITERTPNFASMFIRHEDGTRILYEDDSALVQERAESVVGEERIGLGPTMGDLSQIGFSSNLLFEERLNQEDGDNILMENVAGRILIENPYAGVTISDISTLYGNTSISELEKQEGKQGNLTFSASVQSGV
jgi:hypothetical protein